MARSAKSTNWIVDKRAAAAADRALESEIGTRKLTLSSSDSHFRKKWVDLYIKYGGKMNKLGGSNVRIAPIKLQGGIVKQVDEEFWSRHPRLKRRKLTFLARDRSYRKEWMDIYVSRGGAVVEIGDTGIRVPVE